MVTLLTRRAALAGAALSSAALAFPVAGAVSVADDPDAAIFEAYEKQAAAYNASAIGGAKSADAQIEAMIAAELDVVRLKPITTRGLAVQFVVFTNFGEFEATESKHHDFASTVEAVADVEMPGQHGKAKELASPPTG